MDAKDGWRTTEFWVAVLTAVGMVLNGVVGWGLNVEELVGIIVPVVSYIVSRVVVKSGSGEVKAGWKTTEFWLTVGIGVLVAVSRLLGIGIDPSVLGGVSIPSAAYILSRGVVKR
ncbi:MAG: hypothetical protein QXT73_00650 [Candidatus Methanomethylicaceae archaeon]